jgi:hypothetical protein
MFRVYALLPLQEKWALAVQVRQVASLVLTISSNPQPEEHFIMIKCGGMFYKSRLEASACLEFRKELRRVVGIENGGCE